MKACPAKVSNLKIYHLFLYFLILTLVLGTVMLALPQQVLADTESATTGIDQGPGYITAESALIMDYKTGEIFWEKNSSRPMYPASLTKMLTVIVALENIRDLNEEISISKNAAGRNSSAFTFKKGEKISLKDLIKAALIVSHNNATIALAEKVSGTEEAFIELMNRKAIDIGATNTFFQNTNGLDSDYPLHKTTALDIAKITEYCLGNELFSEIAATRKDLIRVGNREIELESTNKLLVYDYIKGVKTGYTENAGFCIVTYSDREDLELITVVLNSGLKKREGDILKLLNWAYGNFEYTKIIDSKEVLVNLNTYGSTNINIDLYPAEDFVKLLNIKNDRIDIKHSIAEDLSLPLKQNDILGSVEVSLNQEKIEEIDLIIKDSLAEPYTRQDLTASEERQSRLILIFLLSFYFFIFIFIIVRDLFIKKRVIT